MERPHQCQARLFHYPSRGEVVLVSRGKHTPHTQLGETFFDESARSLGGVAFAPCRLAQTIAQGNVVRTAALLRHQAEPSQKLPAGSLDGCPVAKPRETL